MGDWPAFLWLIVCSIFILSLLTLSLTQQCTSSKLSQSIASIVKIHLQFIQEMTYLTKGDGEGAIVIVRSINACMKGGGELKVVSCSEHFYISQISIVNCCSEGFLGFKKENRRRRGRGGGFFLWLDQRCRFVGWIGATASQVGH